MKLEKYKKLFKGDKKIENLVTFLILLIIIVVAINYIWRDDKKNTQKNFENSNFVKQVSTNIEDKTLERKLEDILSNIEGVGKVKVLITYFESDTTIPIYDEQNKVSNTTESDDGGGTRTIEEIDTQKQVVYKENNDGTKEPVTQKISNPKPEGAIITAEGGDDIEIKSKIIEAVEATTSIPTHKIQVYKMKIK